jgi:nucleoid-associated protein YgaU
MAKRTSNRPTAEDSGAAAAPAQPKARRSRATAAAPPAPEADTIAAKPGVQGSENVPSAQNNGSGVASEAGDDAPLESMSTSMGSEPNEEDIRLRAYHRYLERGGGHGMDFEDWLEAERELKNSRSEVGTR